MGAQYLTLTALAIPSDGDVERVYLIDCAGENVCYADAPAFWSTNIGSVDNMAEPKLIVRSWFKWQWWQTGMRWADWTLTYISEVATPIVAPIYVANDMHLHYGVEPTAENIAYIISVKEDITYERAKKIVDDAFYARDGGYTIMTESEWKKEYKVVYNTELLIQKYNANEGALFARFNSKFFDENGEFKAVGTLLFYQIILAAILAVYFTYQLPIVIERNENNETQLKSKLGPRMPKFRFKKREKRLKRKEGN